MLVEVQQQASGLQLEIADFRRSQVVEYRATLPDGSALPPWIQVNPTTGRVSAEIGSNAPLIQLNLVARDADGSSRTLEIKVDLRNPASPSSGLTPVLEVGEIRPSFMAQLDTQHRQWDRYGEQLLAAFN